MSNLSKMSVKDLVARFVALAVDQDEAVLVWDTRKANRLFDELQLVKEELKARPGDQRRELIALHRYPNPQVQLVAAKATLALAYDESRAVLERLAADKRLPQCGYAGMALVNLDEGIYKPS